MVDFALRFCPVYLPAALRNTKVCPQILLSLKRVNSVRPAEPLECVNELSSSSSSVCVCDLKQLKSCHARPNEATGDPSADRSTHEKQMKCYSDRSADVWRKEAKVFWVSFKASGKEGLLRLMERQREAERHFVFGFISLIVHNYTYFISAI